MLTNTICIQKQTAVFGYTYPNTCCHNVLLLTMILTSAFMYFCNTGDFCPCVLTVAIAIK